MSIIILVAMALLVAAPSLSEAKTKLWLYPESDDPRAGGHVVTEPMFTLFVENRGTGDADTASLVSLVVAVNDPALLGTITLIWPDTEVTEIVAAGLQYGTPTLPCDGKDVPRHGIYPTDFTTVSVLNIDSIDEIEPGETVEIEVEVVGDDGLEVHFDAIAQGWRVKKETAVCYGVVNPSGHDVTVILGEIGDADCPDVEINKSADITEVDFGFPVIYTIEIVNTGDCDLTDVVVTEDIPTVGDPAVPAFTVDPATIDPPPVDPMGDPITWNVVDLPPGETATFTFTAVFVEEADGQEVVNTACVTAEGDEIGIEECSSVEVTVGTVCPAVTINKSANTTGVEVGGEVEYTIEVAGSEDCEALTNLIITEDIPTVIDPETGDSVPAFTVDPATIVPPPVDPLGGDPITWNVADLPPGETAVFTFTAVFVEAADGQEVVNTACVTADGIEDPECSSVEVAVGEESADGDIGSPGFWCNRIRFAIEGRHNATYTVEELEAFLLEINEGTDSSDGSSVFSEIYDTSDLALAQDLLCRPQDAESAADRLARHLLTLWFNIVSERVDPEITLGDLCPGDEVLPDGADPAMTVDAVKLGAEAALEEAAEDDVLEWWKDVIDFINNASVGPCEGAEETTPEPRRLRGRHLGRR